MDDVLNEVWTLFSTLSSEPLPFIEGDSHVSGEFIKLCKTIYDSSKSCAVSSGSVPDPLPKLIVENFDNEQVWQEIEMLNKTEVAAAMQSVDFLLSRKRRVTFRLKKPAVEDAALSECSEKSIDSVSIEDKNDNGSREGDENSGEEDGFHFEESDDNDEDEENMSNVMEKTEVDDDFFSLRKMEKFLENEDRKFENNLTKPDDDDIDYFEETLSTDDDDERVSARNVVYNDYFCDPVIYPVQLSDLKETEKGSVMSDKKLSTYEKYQEQIAKKIAVIENKTLEPAQWQMKGEIRAVQRPENSLLQETLTFDHVAQPPTEITEEHTEDLESLIKQRIIDCAWDDVERKTKSKDPAEFKNRIVLESSKSKLTLSEIYEKEYMEKNQNVDNEEKESEAHIEIKKEMKDLFRKLDALSNFHFTATPPEPEIKIVSNMPSITMEEVQPVTHSDAHTLAPEEIFEKSAAGEEKSAAEKSSTDRKRERRKKKLRMKARANARLEKLKKLDPESDAVKKLQAMDQLKKAAKVPRSNTVILKTSKKSAENLTSSQKFFSKLQDQSNLQRSKKGSK